MSNQEQGRRELIQDVIDRLISSSDYKRELIELNNKYSTDFVEERGVRKQVKVCTI